MTIGLQYNWNRWYNAETGRWISEDPIGFAARDMNLLRYVHNGVITNIDPNGKQQRDPNKYIIETLDGENYTSVFSLKLYMHERVIGNQGPGKTSIEMTASAASVNTNYKNHCILLDKIEFTISLDFQTHTRHFVTEKHADKEYDLQKFTLFTGATNCYGEVQLDYAEGLQIQTQVAGRVVKFLDKIGGPAGETELVKPSDVKFDVIFEATSEGRTQTVKKTYHYGDNGVFNTFRGDHL